ncbi:MAG: dynein regulation protein LC7 [Candidatus Aegiribacteria sp.]|nr:dynein regulation protein LC7 [Candidatus Aegiribacteria sp.]
MEKLHKILEGLLEVSGIDVAVCVGRDGFVIDAASTGKADTEAIGAMVSTGMGSAESVGRELGLKEMDQAMMEYKKGIVMMTALGSDALLVVVAAKDANLGGIRLQVRRSAPKLVEAL